MSQQDLEMQDAGNTGIDASGAKAPLPLSDKESRILALYDQLQELNLEIALLAARDPHATSKAEANPFWQL